MPVLIIPKKFYSAISGFPIFNSSFVSLCVQGGWEVRCHIADYAEK
jgi:hypothetical protein